MREVGDAGELFGKLFAVEELGHFFEVLVKVYWGWNDGGPLRAFGCGSIMSAYSGVNEMSRHTVRFP